MGKPFGSALELRHLASTPAGNPPSGNTLLYVKSDGKVYVKSSAGAETPVGDTPTNYVTTDTTQTVAGAKTFALPITVQEVNTPTGPAAGFAKFYFKTDGHLYSYTDNNAENIHPPVKVGTSAPSNPKTGDLWLATGVGAPSASPNFSVGPNNPNLTSPGMWVQTGLGPTGQDWTMWIEDGT